MKRLIIINNPVLLDKTENNNQFQTIHHNVNSEPDKQGNTRKLWIDGLRGLAMVVVVYCHCLLSKSLIDYTAIFVFTCPLNVALFFTISSYLFTPKKGNERIFFKYIILRLVVPWLLLGLFPYYNFVDRIPMILSGEILWFMPALIIAEIVWFYIHKFTKSNRGIILYGLIASFLGLLLFRFGWLNYGMINRALSVQWLFVLGFCLKQYDTYIFSYIKKMITPTLLLYITLVCVYLFIYPNSFFDVHWNRYYFIPLTWSIIILGILIVFSIFKNLTYIPKWLVVVGQNTLFIYIIHGWFLKLYTKIVSISIFSPTAYYFIAVIETIFAIGLCLLFSILLNRYIPEVVGRKRKQ